MYTRAVMESTFSVTLFSSYSFHMFGRAMIYFQGMRFNKFETSVCIRTLASTWLLQ